MGSSNGIIPGWLRSLLGWASKDSGAHDETIDEKQDTARSKADEEIELPTDPPEELTEATSTNAPASQPDLDEQNLNHFLQDFLIPIAADGVLESGVEETPLINAFHLYGIDKQWERDQAAVKEQLKSAIQSASTTFEPSENRIRDAWQRIQDRVDSLTATQYDELRNWLQHSANLNDFKVDLLDVNDSIEFGGNRIEDECVRTFFQVAIDSLKPKSADEADAEPSEAESAPEPKPTSEESNLGEYSKEVAERVVDGSLQEELRGKSSEIIRQMEELFQNESGLDFAFSEFRVCPNGRVLAVKELPEVHRNLWFIGDVHGDLLGLECLLHHIKCFESDHEPTIVFLGDLFDDGKMSYEVVLRVFQLITENPSRVCVITGNHDDGLQWHEDRFRSSVSPSNFTEWLNSNQDDETTRLGRLTVELFQQAPRAIFFPDGLLAAHGGVPHSDLHEKIATPEDLNADECQQDFVWTRLHERAKRRIPNRTTRGCEVGREDFEKFCETTAEVLEQPVERMVRGHDHVEEDSRFKVFKRYKKNPVLTINTMCCRLAREVFGSQFRQPCVARWIEGELPEVVRIEIPSEVIEQVYADDSEEELSEPESDQTDAIDSQGQPDPVDTNEGAIEPTNVEVKPAESGEVKVDTAVSTEPRKGATEPADE